MSDSLDNYLVVLHEQLDTYFDLEEFRAICFELGEDFDNLEGEMKLARIGDGDETYTLTMSEPDVSVLVYDASETAEASGNAFWSFDGQQGDRVVIGLNSRGSDYEIDPLPRPP